ncbi:MAG: hypothetical protein IPM46_01090 [Flavobacteriales bacterium]|nr:hypothetical protein [Flavobacteriales bacterium]
MGVELDGGYGTREHANIDERCNAAARPGPQVNDQLQRLMFDSQDAIPKVQTIRGRAPSRASSTSCCSMPRNVVQGRGEHQVACGSAP